MEEKISTFLAKSGQKLIHNIQIKLRAGPVKSERIAVLSNTNFSIFQKSECKKSLLWIELSSINVTDKDITLKFGKNAFRIYPSDLKLFLSCIFDVIQRVLLPSELEKLDFESFRSFVALPNPFSVSSRIRMKIEESNINYDRSLVQSITDVLSYSRKELDLSKFDIKLIPFILDAIPLYYGIRSIKISSSGKVDAYQHISKLASEKTNLRLIDVKGYSNSNFDTYITNLSLNKSPKLLTLSFESSFFQDSQLTLIKNLFRKTNLKGLEFHDAVAPQAFDFFHDSFFLSLNLKTLNLDGTRGLDLPRIFILIPGLVLLSLESCDLDISDVIVHIQNLKKLRSINLSGNRCTNAAKLRTPLPDNVLSIYVNNVTWENQCLVEFFKYRLMKLSISYISASSDEWQRLFDSLPENQNNTLASIIWDGNNLHSNFFNYLKNQICMNYLSLNDCFTQNHPECLSYLIDYLRYKDLALTEISLRGTESNHIGEYLSNILNIILNSTKINIIDVYGQRGGDQSLLAIKENMASIKVISCDKMNPSRSALLIDLADRANAYQVWLSYPSEDIATLIHSNKMTQNESRSLFNKFRMVPKRIKKQPPRVLYPPPSSSAFDFPFQVYKFIPKTEFPRYLKEKQLHLYEKAPPMSKVAPSIKLPNGQKQVVMSPQSSPHQQEQIQVSINQSPQILNQSNQTYNQSNQMLNQSNQILNQSNQILNQSNQTYNQLNQTYNQSNQTYNQLNQTYNQSNQTYNQLNQTYNQSNQTFNQSNQMLNQSNQALNQSNRVSIQSPRISNQSQQSTPKQQPVQTITFMRQETPIQSNYNDNQDPTLTLGSPSLNQTNQVYNRQSPSNSRQNQQMSPKASQNYDRGSPSYTKNRSKTGSSSPNSIYKEMSRPPPPRFIFEDDPITLEMSREDETILPTIDEEFFPENNDNNNRFRKPANDDYNNNNYYDYNNNNNNFNRTTNQRQIQPSNHSPNKSRSRTNPSRNERATSRNQRKRERPEEEEFFEYDQYSDDNNVKRTTTRRHHYDDDYQNENEDNMRRSSKSRSRGRNEVHRSSSRQHQNRHHRGGHNNNNEYDDENEFFENQPDYDYNDEPNEDDEVIENRQRRTRNPTNNRSRRRNRNRNVPAPETRIKREKPLYNYQDEDDFENEYDDYDDENQYKNPPSRKRRQVEPVKSRTQRETQKTSKTPSPYGRQKKSQSQRPRQRHSQQIDQQPQQAQSQRQHRRNEPSRSHQRVTNRNINYNDEIDDGEDYDENDFSNNYSDDDFDQRKQKAQSMRRPKKVQQVRPKEQTRGQSHRPRAKKLQNDDDDYNNDYDDDQDDGENGEFHRQSRSRQHHRQNQNQVQQSRKQVQHRSAAAPERNHEAPKRQKVERNHEISNRQKVERNHEIATRQRQPHSRSRNRNNNQRINNYNKDFDDENDIDEDNYEEDFENNDDDLHGYSVKRKENLQRNPSRNHSRRQYADDAHAHKIVRNLNHNGSKPSRRPAPKYVKDLSFSSSDSY